MLAGVCGGLAEYLNVDPTVIRVAWVLAALLPVITLPFMVIAYIALALIIPEE